ncbi:unnamed protein product [Ixodes pacificus]
MRCFKRRLRGHISRTCPEKTQANFRGTSGTVKTAGRNSDRNLHAMEAMDSDDSESGAVANLWSLDLNLAVNGVSSRKEAAGSEQKEPPIWAEVTVQGVVVKMKLDTGAVFSVMDEGEFVGRFPNVVVEPWNITLRGYLGQLSPVVGKAMVTAKFVEKTALLPLFIVRGGTPALLGRNWTKAFGMPVEQIVSVHRDNAAPPDGSITGGVVVGTSSEDGFGSVAPRPPSQGGLQAAATEGEGRQGRKTERPATVGRPSLGSQF